METWILDIANNHAYLVYLIIGLVGIAEGPILAVLMGIMIKSGYFSFLPVYLTLMCADLLGDVGMYYLGYHYGKKFINRFGKKFNVTEEGVQKMENLYHKHKHKILFISKLTGGLGLP
ncbi:MAG: DedA family protein, partial [Minisyncoccia bacterium]